MKAAFKSAFTAWIFCIATYATLAMVIAIAVLAWRTRQ